MGTAVAIATWLSILLNAQNFPAMDGGFFRPFLEYTKKKDNPTYQGNSENK